MKKFLGRLAATALLALPLAAHALPFSSLVVFGDSLSDAGDSPSAVASLIKLAPGFAPPPPYDGGRFSNGPVGVENLASIRGINNPLQFQDFAVGGATTADIRNMINNVYLAHTGGLADPNALYMVWGGPNNFFGGSTDYLGAANDIFASTKALLDAGARMALIPTMPDISRTPDAAKAAAQLDLAFPGTGAGAALLAGLHNLSLAYDAALNGVVTNLRGLYPGANIIGFDTMGAANAILDNPGAYGFTNVTDSCVATPACVTDPSQWDHYFYWDGKHPTAAVHAIFGSLLAMTVPEPGTLLLMGLALVGIAATRRRVRA
jgi:phospholipase/lecithinase/hemolysin